MTLRLQQVDAGDVAAVTLLGWIAGSTAYAFGFVVFGIFIAAFEEPSLLVMIPPALFMALVGAGTLSSIWVLSTGALTVFVLKAGNASPRNGAIALVIVGVVYAVALSRTEFFEWALPFNGVPAGLLYGSAFGIIYAKVNNV